MKLWGGRFSKNTDSEVNDFNSSIRFDSRMYEQDIKGSEKASTFIDFIVLSSTSTPFPICSENVSKTTNAVIEKINEYDIHLFTIAFTSEKSPLAMD